MRLDVETCRDTGMELPRAFHFNGRRVAVIEVVDQWFGSDYRYCKLKGDDGALYILRCRTLLRLATHFVLEPSHSVGRSILRHLSCRASR